MSEEKWLTAGTYTITAKLRGTLRVEDGLQITERMAVDEVIYEPTSTELIDWEVKKHETPR